MRWWSESLKSSSARSTFAPAVVGTARTWRGSLGLERAGAGAATGSSARNSVGSATWGSGSPHVCGGGAAPGSERRRRRRESSDGPFSSRGKRAGTDPSADSRIQPWCVARVKQSWQTRFRCPPGAR